MEAIDRSELRARRALVVYESMFGNGRTVAEAIARGLSAGLEARAVAVHVVDAEEVAAADLLVVGGPTHMHGMASAMSRRTAVQIATDAGVDLEPCATAEPTLRTWLSGLHGERRRAAAFDTRSDHSVTISGSAARGIAKRLRRHGYVIAADSNSFFVDDTTGPLSDGELDRAERWGAGLARLITGEPAVPAGAR
ncbi:MAG: flavodoxin domain-containing protein [Solirubrobacterales bacterium]